MKKIFLKPEKANNIESFHNYLKEVFEFPAYYGGNLDSLYDCLTSISECITVAIPLGLDKMLDGYGGRIIKVLEDAAYYNDYLHLYKEDATNQP